MRRTVIALGLVAGCDPIVDTRYVGEPMFTLTGTVVSPAKGGEAIGGVALLWQDSGGAGGPGVAATTVPFVLEFPATFELAIPLPPPAAARFGFDDSDVDLAEAYIAVVTDPDAPRLVARGIARTHALVFASADVAEGTEAADYLGGPVTAGYHLRRYTALASAAAPAQRTMISRCVASGSSQAACDARRGYQLEHAADDERLRIVVAP